MKKWAISALVYLLVVVGGYYAYASFTDEADLHNDTSAPHEQEEESSHGQEHKENGENHNGESEVKPTLQVENGELIITLKDLEGNPVSDLEVNHEKLLHLIVVSKDLKEYQHLHPQTNKPGVFKVAHALPAGEYKAFVDIKPTSKNYEVAPISFIVGENYNELDEDSLTVDAELIKAAGGHTVKMLPSSLKVNEDIQLTFDLGEDTPEQYLGALGHVVILDQKGENYIHVHPLKGNEPVFATKFSEPGIYKIWAEFKFNGQVFVYPYVVEIK
ncbi:hypothetical protein ABC255_08340 [Neobacillus sp. 3P2-tot-E-2]|uniref:hypothetical protein n=1 Tax=Neobacillus sp. 3P2-tot-E-2 TaxID=3132212 RepID=UPI00399F9AFC